MPSWSDECLNIRKQEELSPKYESTYLKTGAGKRPQRKDGYAAETGAGTYKNVRSETLQEKVLPRNHPHLKLARRISIREPVPKKFVS